MHIEEDELCLLWKMIKLVGQPFLLTASLGERKI